MDSRREDTGSLFLAVLLRYLIVIVALGTLFFVTAGTFDYWNGWLYLATIFVTMGAGFAVLYVKDKSLLGKRIKTREKESRQKAFVAVSSLLILLVYGIPGLDYRMAWSKVPVYLVIFGELLLIGGYTLNMGVMLVNSYASRTVEIQEGQRVIEDGPYSVVRHPMYAAMIPIYLGTCLILGSFVAIVPCLLLVAALGFRAVQEEKTLVAGLEGYDAYRQKIKYRMIPFIW